ncbi:hypothetical protein F2Q68_00044456 [Brassica cretica]|uniref:Uncharacterized protein n=1 Tax=Brassica cretica TaxID=69181 RepID=A0A8S9LVD3_BRACR|nr:hypothetical protein F2Q68_00044456 [Brassica cretica]
MANQSKVPFASFEERLQRSRRLFSSTVPIIGDKTQRFPSMLPTLMEAKKQSTQLNQPQQPPQQLAVSTAQPATSISTQGSSTSGVTNLPTLMEAKKQSTQLNQPQQPPQQLAVSTAQPATSISTQGSSTSGVTNVY